VVLGARWVYKQGYIARARQSMVRVCPTRYQVFVFTVAPVLFPCPLILRQKIFVEKITVASVLAATRQNNAHNKGFIVVTKFAKVRISVDFAWGEVARAWLFDSHSKTHADFIR
jgi:hypothetical protein